MPDNPFAFPDGQWPGAGGGAHPNGGAIEAEVDPLVSSAELRGLLGTAMRMHSQLSDINLTPGRLPQVEVGGALQQVELGQWKHPLQPEDTEAIADAIIGNDAKLRATFEESGSTDCAVELDCGTRFRVNIFRARDEVSIVLRILPQEIPTIERLGLPAGIAQIPPIRDGLVLVTGATGSGKSTTLAAIVNEINATRPVHIVTLEDPVEFSHPHKAGTINQRELGRDFHDFSVGLRAALRQAPKVILVGEMRDRETMEIGLKAAETGHLVLSTLHTVRAGDAIHRIGGMFDGPEQGLIRSRLAQVLRFVVGQRLLPKQGGGRVAALEILGNNLRVRNLIENGEDAENTFPGVIADNRPRGWQTFDHHIVEHYAAGHIDAEVALAYCADRSEVQRQIDKVKNQRGQATSDIGDLQMENVRTRK